MTNTVVLEEIVYRPDGADLFASFVDLPGAVFLDSSQPHCQRGRFDIISALPAAAPAPPDIPATGSAVEARAWREYFRELHRFHRSHYDSPHPASPDIPFCGGLLGMLDYDTGNALQGVAHPGSQGSGRFVPRIGAYDWAIVQDHLLQRSVLVSQPGVATGLREDLRKRASSAGLCDAGASFKLGAAFSSNLSAAQYASAFDRILDYIHAGDCYQVNLAQRFDAPYTGDPWLAYRALRAVAAAPWSAFLSLGDGEAMLSLSPERFIALHGTHVQTSPIKGTRPRYRDLDTDTAAARELSRSVKDRAENLMIVDLLRNDLGRNCTPGSIHVDALFEVQSFPTVHHMVSNISGELAPGRSAYDLLGDAFPGGSITGAPKRRAMEVIAELEPHAREAYCGSVFYVSADGRMDSNIAIRSLLCSGGTVRCWGGGGIVADSTCEAEYQETFDKVGRFLELLEGL